MDVYNRQLMLNIATTLSSIATSLEIIANSVADQDKESKQYRDIEERR